MNVEVKNGGIQTGPHVCKYLSIYSFRYCFTNMGFPESSVGKESACNAGYPGSIPGSGRFAKEGISSPLQYSWVSLSGSAAKESACNARDLGSILGCEDPLEKGTATHSSILAWRIPWTI